MGSDLFANPSETPSRRISIFHGGYQNSADGCPESGSLSLGFVNDDSIHVPRMRPAQDPSGVIEPPLSGAQATRGIGMPA